MTVQTPDRIFQPDSVLGAITESVDGSLNYDPSIATHVGHKNYQDGISRFSGALASKFTLVIASELERPHLTLSDEHQHVGVFVLESVPTAGEATRANLRSEWGIRPSNRHEGGQLTNAMFAASKIISSREVTHGMPGNNGQTGLKGIVERVSQETKKPLAVYVRGEKTDLPSIMGGLLITETEDPSEQISGVFVSKTLVAVALRELGEISHNPTRYSHEAELLYRVGQSLDDRNAFATLVAAKAVIANLSTALKVQSRVEQTAA